MHASRHHEHVDKYTNSQTAHTPLLHHGYILVAMDAFPAVPSGPMRRTGASCPCSSLPRVRAARWTPHGPGRTACLGQHGQRPESRLQDRGSDVSRVRNRRWHPSMPASRRSGPCETLCSTCMPRRSHSRTTPPHPAIRGEGSLHGSLGDSVVGLGIEAKKSRKEEATQERRRHNKAQHAQRQAHARRHRLGSKGKRCPSLSSCSPSPLGIHSPRSILCGRRRRRALPVPLFRCAVLAVSLAVTASPSRPHAGRGTRAHTQAGRPHTSVACGGQRERGSAGIGTRKRAARQVKTRGGGCAQHHETRGGSSDNVRGAGQRVRPAAPLLW